jgi:hypothetical protein
LAARRRAPPSGADPAARPATLPGRIGNVFSLHANDWIKLRVNEGFLGIGYGNGRMMTLPALKTRGELRRLCIALGIKIEAD